MKSRLSFIALLFMSCGVLSAQPVIQDGSNRPDVGFSTPVSMSLAATSPGAAGANQTWDFSAVGFQLMGEMTIVDFATSDHADYFSGANYLMELTVGGNTLYTYQNYSASKMEEYSASVAGPGVDNDYSPNPPTRLIFPMSLGSSASDTWQVVNQSQNSVTITYDAYGTFISPYNTYTNVVRVANDYGDAEIDYSFWTTSPLRLLAVHRHENNALVLLDGATVGVDDNVVETTSVFSVYPNPVLQNIAIRMDVGFTDPAVFVLYNIAGQLVLEVELTQKSVSIDRGSLPAGLYVYSIKSGAEILQTDKLSFN